MQNFWKKVTGKLPFKVCHEIITNKIMSGTCLNIMGGEGIKVPTVGGRRDETNGRVCALAEAE